MIEKLIQNNEIYLIKQFYKLFQNIIYKSKLDI